MKLNSESEYGLAALTYLARQAPGAVLQVRQVARAEGLPEMYLAKIFLKLAKHGVLRSYRGRKRGYSLARPPSQISVREVLEGIEGGQVFLRCVFWSNECSDDRPCPLHEIWKVVRPQLVGVMNQITLEKVARRRLAGIRLAGARQAGRSRQASRARQAPGGG